MTSGIWNTGSVVDFIAEIIGWSNIPTSVSGTTFSNIVEQEINFVELYTTDTIDSSAIPEKYQPSIIKLAQADILLSIDTQQGGINNVSLGELSIAGGQSSNSAIAKQLKEEAILRLKELQRTVRMKRVIGGI